MAYFNRYLFLLLFDHILYSIILIRPVPVPSYILPVKILGSVSDLPLSFSSLVISRLRWVSIEYVCNLISLSDGPITSNNL
jgi:hypothetical protein